MTDRELPIASVIGVLFFIGISIVYFFLASPAHTLPVVNQILSVESKLWALQETDIVPIDTSLSQKTIDLKDFGFVAAPKELFFENSSSFIALSRPHASLVQGFLFKSPALSGLQRCNVDTLSCSRLDMRPSINIGSAYHVAVLPNENLVVANVGQHELHLLSHSGQFIKKVNGFRYPNVVEYFNNELWVVDTNNHRFVSIESAETDFGAVKKEVVLGSIDGLDLIKNYPIGLEFDGEYWYALIANGFLSNADLYRIDKKWGAAKKINLPEEVDVSSFLVDEDKTYWLAGFDGRLWKKYDSFSEWQLVESDSLKLSQEALIEKIEGIKLRDWLVAGLGVLLAMITLLFGLKKSKPVAKDKALFNLQSGYKESEKILPFPPFKDDNVRWLSRNERWLKMILYANLFMKVSAVLIVVAAATSFWLLEDIKPGNGQFLLSVYALLISFYIATYWLVSRAMNTRIGIQGELLLIARNKKIIAKAKPDEIVYCEYMLYIPKAVAGMGSAVMRFYKEESERKGLQPFLQRGEKVSEVGMYWFLLRKLYPPACVVLGIVFVGILVIVWLR
ncbi:hypothetical protein IMCC1989_718 [gamma proteobacterium IMCC1989]|nr:hypothetical protein IMCC1989_718 [gamma proteobacterium IMCC1989]